MFMSATAPPQKHKPFFRVESPRTSDDDSFRIIIKRIQAPAPEVKSGIGIQKADEPAIGETILIWCILRRLQSAGNGCRSQPQWL